MVIACSLVKSRQVRVLQILNQTFLIWIRISLPDTDVFSELCAIDYRCFSVLSMAQVTSGRCVSVMFCSAMARATFGDWPLLENAPSLGKLVRGDVSLTNDFQTESVHQFSDENRGNVIDDPHCFALKNEKKKWNIGETREFSFAWICLFLTIVNHRSAAFCSHFHFFISHLIPAWFSSENARCDGVLPLDFCKVLRVL